LQTRFATIVAFMLSLSFGNANPYLDNAGDTIRGILLMYLMLCPAGAVWSIDALLHKKKGPLFVHPWPIRLLFVQMIYVYFMNGAYKLMGPNWIDGYSLHYVLGDLAITRFSPVMLPLPTFVGRLMTWSVLIWEVTFPFLVFWTWSRRAALIMGVLFHLGIFATMELGGFVPYALCMYIPLLPWGGSKPLAQSDA
jgi:HTTM domain